MSLLRRALGLDAPTPNGLPAPRASLQLQGYGDTLSVRKIGARLTALPPDRARFVAAFAYLLGRAAEANLEVTDDERAEMGRLIAEVGGLDADTAGLVVDLADTQAGEFGATEDFLVTREFLKISTMDERERLLRCCLLVMSVDGEVDAEEAWLVNRLAEELEIARPDLNRIRAEFHDRLSGVREIRRLAAEAGPVDT